MDGIFRNADVRDSLDRVQFGFLVVLYHHFGGFLAALGGVYNHVLEWDGVEGGGMEVWEGVFKAGYLYVSFCLFFDC